MTITQRTLGTSDAALTVSASGWAAWGCRSSTARPTSRGASTTIHRALDLGVTFLDTADMYGPFTNEQLVGRAIEGRRDEVQLATKFGNVRGRERRAARHQRLARLRPRRPATPRSSGSASTTSTSTTSTASTRPSRSRRPSARWTELVEAGKVRHLGLSEAAPDDHPPRARRAPDHRAADASTRCSPATSRTRSCDAARARHRAGPLLPARPRPAHRRDHQRRRRRRRRRHPPLGVLPALPGRGARRQPGARRRRSREIAEEKGCTPGQLALAWVLAQGDDVAPIPGHQAGEVPRGERRRPRRRSSTAEDLARSRTPCRATPSPATATATCRTIDA